MSYLFKDGGVWRISTDRTDAANCRSPSNKPGCATSLPKHPPGCCPAWMAPNLLLQWRLSLCFGDDSIENAGVVVRQGFPQRIETQFAGLPAEFESNLECVFKGLDGKTHFFKDGKTVALDGNDNGPDTAGSGCLPSA
ncbi:MAG: hypothetical protein R3E79_53050 [Caldilineaceae bacterium]